jgi:hypothetical protein
MAPCPAGRAAYGIVGPHPKMAIACTTKEIARFRPISAALRSRTGCLSEPTARRSLSALHPRHEGRDAFGLCAASGMRTGRAQVESSPSGRALRSSKTSFRHANRPREEQRRIYFGVSGVTWDDNGLTIVLGNQAIHLDPITLAALLVALAVVLGTAFVFARKRKSHCRWQRLPEGGTPSFTKWRCRNCIMEAFTTDRKPPKECKRVLRSNL